MKKRYSTNIILFLLATFLLRIPPLYFVGIKNIFLTTHFLSVFIFFWLFINLLWEIIILKKQKYFLKSTVENKLILLFFVTQSFSIISAVNIPIFIQRYLKIIIGIIVFLIVKKIFNENRSQRYYKIILNIFFLGFIISFFLQSLLLINQNIYFDIGSFFIYDNVLKITEAHYQSLMKIFDDTYFEIITPILCYFLLSQKTQKVRLIILYLFIILFVGIISFISNFRYRLISFVIPLIISIYIYRRKKSIKKKGFFTKAFILLFLIFLIFNLTNFFLRNYLRIPSILERFTLKEDAEGYATIKSRIESFNTSIEFVKSNVLGVGVGNFYDNLPNKNKIVKFYYGPKKDTSLAALKSGPHNIFFQILAETGFFGLFSFIILVVFYIYKDFNLIKKQVLEEKAVFILSFWTLMVTAQFIPSINLTFYFLFFLFRGII